MWANRVLLGVCAVSLTACSSGTEDTSEAVEAPGPESVNVPTSGEAPGDQPDSWTIADAPEPLDIGPITYFDNHCASCHGGNGSLYARPFVTPDDELMAIVEEMCAGPAMMPLEGRPLDALVEYHRAMRDRVPFVALVERDANGIVFETTPGASIAVTGGEATKIGLDTWRVEATGAVSLRVDAAGTSYRLPDWPEEAWSVGRPLDDVLGDD